MSAPSREQVLAEMTKPGGPFEITEVDIGGSKVRAYVNAPSSMRMMLEMTRGYGDRDFLVYGEDRVTFAQHLELVAGLAKWLADHHGVGKGDRLAIGMRNYPEWLVAFWAPQVLGAITVPLNAWWSEAELRYALDDAGVSFAIVDGERYERMVHDLAELKVPTIVVRHDGEVAEGAVHWSAVLAELDRSGELPDVSIEPDDPSTILYTSGTTGHPKGAIGTHRNHMATFMNTALNGALDQALAGPPRQDAPANQPSMMVTFPFFHIGGINLLCMGTGFGLKLVLQYKWNLVEALELIQRERITSFAAVPMILRQLVESPLCAEYDLSSLTMVTGGAAAVPPDLVGGIGRTFGPNVKPATAYGLTEASGAATVHPAADYVGRTTSVGRAHPVVDVHVVDPETGQRLPTGSIGELWVHGPTVVAGYWNKPEATEAAFTDGWFHTGDLGYLDEEGFVYIVDRIKDMVIRGGENVYCAEVEAVLFEHPAVADVAIVGIPHRELGEQVAAVVQLREGASASADELKQHVAAQLAYFKVPEHVFFRDESLPRTATGKVLKRDLRNELAPS